MNETHIRNAIIVNEGRSIQGDVLIRKGHIERIGSVPNSPARRREIDAMGLHLLPGVIDDQVHFREPGLTHKGDIRSESRAAVAGGVTSFMEMPNTSPSTTTIAALEEKYAIASRVSPANYSFYLGATPDNLSELEQVDHEQVCGVKIFMGSSTGSLLVDDPEVLDHIFRNVDTLIATHCESDSMIKENADRLRAEFGENIPVGCHPHIRTAEACYASSAMAIEIAKKYNTRLHILHISTELETSLFSNELPLDQKRITAEACVHHLWFTDADYDRLGTRIKWNPAIKTALDRDAVRAALLDNRIDVIATDHAPHTLQEKANAYFTCPSGGPLIQHSLVAMLQGVKEGWISLERVVEKMSHAPAQCYRMKDRGFIREGYYADLVLVNLNAPWIVSPNNILYKCGWSPFEGQQFDARVVSTFVNGNEVWSNNSVSEKFTGMRLTFDRNRR